VALILFRLYPANCSSRPRNECDLVAGEEEAQREAGEEGQGLAAERNVYE
jgi:hypothetical protein